MSEIETTVEGGFVEALFGVAPATPADVFPGWWDPELQQSGWGHPHFTRATVEEILAQYDWYDPGSTTTVEGRGGWTWDGDVLVITSVDGVDRYEPVTLPGVPEPVYALGAWSWCWEVVPVPDGADLGEHLAGERARRDTYVTAAQAASNAALDAGLGATRAGELAEQAGNAAVAAMVQEEAR